MDANNGLYPLAFSIVESECNKSWIWFLRQVNELLPVVTNRHNLCIISYRHAGLVRGCREIQWLMDRDVSRWSLTNDGGFRYGVMTTIAAESFNGVLKRARELPIQALIMAIYYNIISMFMTPLEFITTEEQQNNDFFPPCVHNSVKRFEEEARRMPEPIRLNMHEFQVADMSSKSYRDNILDGRRCKCSCGKPLLYHLPCSHVVCCLAMLRRSHFDYVSPYYTRTNYKLSYSGEFHHIPNKEEWGENNPNTSMIPLLPPNYRRRSGRPRTNRYRNTMDEAPPRSNRVCRACHLAEHNRATCPTRFGHRN
ncbi:hypothetical protein MA16_Dca027602 [Dendrobium catenatum]|uniref:SWIM-type domain-containing protein n=1 Tax=Dendrobium catenatum TaxID=906689 RepID=A0A2I0VFZ6_9ASPA|nr:hypothetical protein MA16_Dca027602 [Dendrobium catenatum]